MASVAFSLEDRVQGCRAGRPGRRRSRGSGRGCAGWGSAHGLLRSTPEMAAAPGREPRSSLLSLLYALSCLQLKSSVLSEPHPLLPLTVLKMAAVQPLSALGWALGTCV